MGLTILAPDINRSEIKYKGKDSMIRVGLMQLKELSLSAARVVIDERKKRGAFSSLKDFLERTGSRLYLKDVRVLIKSGCLDSISEGVSRAGLMWQALEFFNKREPGQGALFFDSFSIDGTAGFTEKKEPGNPPGVKRKRRDPGPYKKELTLRHEVENLGFMLSVHPLDLYRDALSRLDYVAAKELKRFIGRDVSTIGLFMAGKTVHTSRGDLMKFVSFEDRTGLYETVFFPDVYNRFCHMLEPMKAYILKGKVEEDLGALAMTVSRIDPLDKTFLE